MEVHYWLDTRDKPGLLVAVMRALAANALISFEGDLRQCAELFSIPGATTQESDALKRQTTYPTQEFVVLPLDQQTIRTILEIVQSGAHLARNILHVQIEKNGRLAFGAYDNFHRDCVVAWSQVPYDLLVELQSKDVLRSFRLAPSETDAEK